MSAITKNDTAKRLIGVAVGFAATKLAMHGVALDENVVAAITLAVYGIVHTVLDRVF